MDLKYAYFHIQIHKSGPTDIQEMYGCCAALNPLKAKVMSVLNYLDDCHCAIRKMQLKDYEEIYTEHNTSRERSVRPKQTRTPKTRLEHTTRLTQNNRLHKMGKSNYRDKREEGEPSQS